ncbi:hypothetical protein PoB_000564000 [Plakobranchus ocellatus]|uniref:Uncharacterized protein n=1 Tax=Plakobranchus ocellatus TaxID=259542 RepID=A0AAV3Y9E8_9GAST|nr:hypothetical protein PoB_000564000 [Plakobranchus ocellatus]
MSRIEVESSPFFLVYTSHCPCTFLGKCANLFASNSLKLDMRPTFSIMVLTIDDGRTITAATVGHDILVKTNALFTSTEKQYSYH